MKLEADVKWLETPFWPKYFKIMQGDSPVSNARRNGIILLSILLIMVTLCFTLAFGIILYLYLMPVIAMMAMLAVELWRRLLHLFGLIIRVANVMSN